MAGWIFQDSPGDHDLDARIAASPERWWGSGLLDDATLGSFRPFHGFRGSNVPVPPDVAAALSELAVPRLVAVPGRPGEGGHPAPDDHGWVTAWCPGR
jgi:hypothetical protein